MKDDNWFANIKWNEDCIKCREKHGNMCPMRDCAEFNYDEWGDRIPDYLYHDDGNEVAEYLAEKRKRMEGN